MCVYLVTALLRALARLTLGRCTWLGFINYNSMRSFSHSQPPPTIPSHMDDLAHRGARARVRGVRVVCPRSWDSPSPEGVQSCVHVSLSLIVAMISPRSVGSGVSINMVPRKGRVWEGLVLRWEWSARSICLGRADGGISKVCSRKRSLRMRRCTVRQKCRLCAMVALSHPVIIDCICKSKFSRARNASLDRCHPAYPCATTETP